MVTKTKAAAAEEEMFGLSEEDIAAIESGDYAKMEERIHFVDIVELEIEPASEEWMSARNINFNDPRFQALFPDGFPVLKMGLRGINVEYAYSADKIRRVYIQVKNDHTHAQPGSTKGRRTQFHITNTAFKDVFGVVPIGKANQQAIMASGPIRFGEHLGEFTPQGESQTREIRWPIPRQKLGLDFKYDGEVQVLQGRAENTGGGGAVGVAGTAQLSEEESSEAVAKALLGLATDDIKAHEAAITRLNGLTQRWYDAMVSGDVASLANEEGLIVALSDGTIGLPDSES